MNDDGYGSAMREKMKEVMSEAYESHNRRKTDSFDNFIHRASWITGSIAFCLFIIEFVYQFGRHMRHG